jgi:hypothetical protein
MKNCPKCDFINPDSAQRCDCGWDFNTQTVQDLFITLPSPEETGYEILPNGKKRYLRATVGDIAFCILLPFWGLLIGGIALARGEARRGLTMMLLGVGLLIVILLIRLL